MANTYKVTMIRNGIKRVTFIEMSGNKSDEIHIVSADKVEIKEQPENYSQGLLALACAWMILIGFSLHIVGVI